MLATKQAQCVKATSALRSVAPRVRGEFLDAVYVDVLPGSGWAWISATWRWSESAPGSEEMQLETQPFPSAGSTRIAPAMHSSKSTVSLTSCCRWLGARWQSGWTAQREQISAPAPVFRASVAQLRHVGVGDLRSNRCWRFLTPALSSHPRIATPGHRRRPLHRIAAAAGQEGSRLRRRSSRHAGCFPRHGHCEYALCGV